jgi:hypothetical protein
LTSRRTPTPTFLARDASSAGRSHQSFVSLKRADFIALPKLNFIIITPYTLRLQRLTVLSHYIATLAAVPLPPSLSPLSPVVIVAIVMLSVGTASSSNEIIRRRLTLTRRTLFLVVGHFAAMKDTALLNSDRHSIAHSRCRPLFHHTLTRIYMLQRQVSTYFTAPMICRFAVISSLTAFIFTHYIAVVFMKLYQARRPLPTPSGARYRHYHISRRLRLAADSTDSHSPPLFHCRLRHFIFSRSLLKFMFISRRRFL